MKNDKTKIVVTSLFQSNAVDITVQNRATVYFMGTALLYPGLESMQGVWPYS